MGVKLTAVSATWEPHGNYEVSPWPIAIAGVGVVAGPLALVTDLESSWLELEARD